jgi:hypothetical protein
MIEVLSIISPIAPLVQKVCGNCHETDASFLQRVVFIVMLIIQNQWFKN